jgi:hypothetical protein
VVIEGAVNFAVVPSGRSGALASTVSQSGFVMERLTRDQAKYADGPVNLIEATDFPILYQKAITPHTWGVLVFECVYALNILSGGSVRHTLQDPRWRLVYATMIREACEGLFEAARGGVWSPSMELLLSFGAGPWLLEMILVLPGPLFALAANCVGVPRSDLLSPGQFDISVGRKTETWNQLDELVSAGQRYSNK